MEIYVFCQGDNWELFLQKDFSSINLEVLWPDYNLLWNPHVPTNLARRVHNVWTTVDVQPRGKFKIILKRRKENRIVCFFGGKDKQSSCLITNCLHAKVKWKMSQVNSFKITSCQQMAIIQTDKEVDLKTKQSFFNKNHNNYQKSRHILNKG